MIGVEHPATSSSKCFGAAWAYGFCVLLSIATIAYDRFAPAPPAHAGGYADMGPDLDFLGADAVAERDRRRADRGRSLGGLELQPMAMGTML